MLRRNVILLFMLLLGLVGLGMLATEPLPVQAAPCAGGPTIDGITLDECYDHEFQVDGNDRTIRVWYTKNQTEATREVDGSDVTLQHWINDDQEAIDVAEFAEEAWLAFYSDSGGVEPYITGCSDRLNFQLEDGVGWAGVAYWASSGNCTIGIDSPMIRNGGGVGDGDGSVIAHEVLHYVQYSYGEASGCYASWKPNYPDNSEFIEGYADLAPNGIDDALDDTTYDPVGYDVSTSFYDKGYNNIFVLYFVEQLGTIGTRTDNNYGMDAMYEHYVACNNASSLYVLNSLIPSLDSNNRSEQAFFLDFFAALWANDWSDTTTQPELSFAEFTTDAFGGLNSVALTEVENISSGTESWSDTTPDDWAANYYEVRPQTGCDYVQVEVDGAAGANLGINLMAADTSAPTVLRSAGIGEDFVRTFAGNGTHDRIVAIVNSFATNYSYDVSFTCSTPTLNILEPRQTNVAHVGAPDSPIAFLTRFSVTDGSGSSVRGLPESSFSFDADGDAATVVPGSFQEVGGEYWATLIPPTKPAGTTFVDYTVTLDSTGPSDTETSALLYVDPGNVDTALVFDASGSMDTEDITGEPTRLDQAQRSGKVVANLLRPGDRILVTDFSALDDPPGCGASTNECPLDIRTLIPRQDNITAGNVAGIIDNVETAIDGITAREWTPIGPAVEDAKNKLLAAPFGTNPKFIFLLSDGEENIKPFWDDVRTEIVDSGVVVNTIAFGPEAPGGLMSEIAAATGGTFRPVATTGGGVNLAQVTSLTGQLGLADVYDSFDTESQQGTRILQSTYLNVPDFTWRETSAYVDESATELRFVVAGDTADQQGFGGARDVQVQPPSWPINRDLWGYDISPVVGDPPNDPPDDWIIRNESYNDVLIVPNPEPGLWRFRTRYDQRDFINLQNENGADAPQQFIPGPPTDFIMNASLQSDIRLDGRILGLDMGKGTSGDTVQIIGTLLTRTGGLAGADVEAIIEYTPINQAFPGSTTIPLFDDGNHGDGGANDGIYGATFAQTAVGGSYSVRIVAEFDDPAGTETLTREWNGGFWMKGPRPNDDDEDPDFEDADNDNLPDDWERRCGLPTDRDNRLDDSDGDQLTDLEELLIGTLPCRRDTDNGGEQDGSEVFGGRDPLEPRDDFGRSLTDPDDDGIGIIGIITYIPGNGYIDILWPVGPDFDFDRLIINWTDDPDDPDQNTTTLIDPEIGEGRYRIPDLDNGKTYYVELYGEKDEGGETFQGDTTEPEPVMPKNDPNEPGGTMLIENGNDTTPTRDVTLYISAINDINTSDENGGPISGGAAPSGIRSLLTNNIPVAQAGSGVEMRISNSADFAGATWEPLDTEKEWTLECEPDESCVVYAQFRDDAEPEPNISEVVWDTIELVDDGGPSPSPSGEVYLPIIRTE